MFIPYWMSKQERFLYRFSINPPVHQFLHVSPNVHKARKKRWVSVPHGHPRALLSWAWAGGSSHSVIDKVLSQPLYSLCHQDEAADLPPRYITE